MIYITIYKCLYLREKSPKKRRNVFTYWNFLAFDDLQTLPEQLLVHHANVGLVHKGHIL